MQQMAQALQSAQQSLQQAGQQQASGQKGEASEAQMGKEPGQGSGQPGAQQGQAQGSRNGGKQSSPSTGGFAGSAGAQQPLPGKKKDSLVRAAVNDKGEKLSRSYMGTPDPTKDKAAYYSMVPDRIKAQEASLNKEEIPTGYKKQVRDYFESIQPK